MELEVQATKTENAPLRVLLSLEAMQKTQIQIGELISLKKSPDQIAFGQAWPSVTTSAKNVELSTSLRLSGSFMLGDKIIIAKTNYAEIEADQIKVKVLSKPSSQLTQSLITYVKHSLAQQQWVAKGQMIDLEHYATRIRIEIVDIVSKLDSTVYQISQKTKIQLIDLPQVAKKANQTDTIGYKNIGGLESQIKIVKEMIETPLNRPELFTKYGLKPPRGLLLFGPPGTGKTLIARAAAHEAGAHSIIVNGPEIVSKFFGETEQRLRDIFEEAAAHAPTIIFIDEIDSLCSKRDEAPSELEKRIVTTLLTLMDGAKTIQGRVVVIGATNRPNALDEALRRPGRFDREVEIGIPNSHSRESIFKTILLKMPHSLQEVEIEQLAQKTHGYVGADIAALCREAGLKCIKRLSATPQEPLEVNLQDMKNAMIEIRPSAMREITLEVPKVYWSDIGGQADIKQRLKESVEWPLQHPEAFQRLGIRPPKGVLLYGPPGCSKTLMAKALATEAGSNFIAVKGPELLSKWVGESEKAVREVFRKARAASPSIVFFDEIDALTVKRGSGEGGTSVADRVLSQLLNELDGVESLVNVTVVAATNRPDIIDDALLRPGRIDRILYVGPPDYSSRKEIFRIQLKKMTCADDVDLEEIAIKSDGCSGAEAVAICQEAALIAMEEDVYIDSIKMRHFTRALNSFTRRITPEMLRFYADYQEKSGLQSI